MDPSPEVVAFGFTPPEVRMLQLRPSTLGIANFTSGYIPFDINRRAPRDRPLVVLVNAHSWALVNQQVIERAVNTSSLPHPVYVVIVQGQGGRHPSIPHDINVITTGDWDSWRGFSNWLNGPEVEQRRLRR